MPPENNDFASTLLCTIDGYDIRITPSNTVFVRFPDGQAGFPYIDRFQNLLFSGGTPKPQFNTALPPRNGLEKRRNGGNSLPAAVEVKVRLAVANRERARILRRQHELAEPPDDLRGF